MALPCPHRFLAVVSGIMYSLTHPPGSTNADGRLLKWQDKLTRQEFKSVLEHVDRGLRALPATAQVGCSYHPLSWDRDMLASYLLAACCLPSMRHATPLPPF